MVKQQGDTPFGQRMFEKKSQGGMHLEDHEQKTRSWKSLLVRKQTSEVYAVGASIEKNTDRPT